MWQSFQVKAAVDKEKCQPLLDGDVRLASFALGATNVEEDLSFVLIEREREHVGLIGFVAVLAVHAARKDITANDERKLVCITQHGVGHAGKRNAPREPRALAAHRCSYRKNTRTSERWVSLRWGVTASRLPADADRACRGHEAEARPSDLP